MRAVTWIVTVLLVVLAGVYLAHWARGEGLDLRVYRAGIDSWRSGHDPYLGAFTIHGLRFTYPPIALLALSPLTWAPFAVTQAALWILSITVLAGTVYTVCVRCGRAGGSLLLAQSLGWASLAVLVVEPVRSNLDYDQINTLLMGMVVVDLLVVPRRHRGWLVGLAAAIKLTPLIFLAIPLLERDWRSAGRSAGAAVGATGLAWLLCPAASWTYWSKDVFDARRVGDVAYAGNQSLYGDLHRWPFASGGHTAIWVVISAATLVMGAYVTKRCLLDNRRVAAVLSLAFVGLEVSPISWTHHWVWVALVPPVLVVGRRQVPGLATRTSLWVLSGVSVLAPYWWFGSGVAREWLGDSLSLCAFVMLALWSGSEYTNRADGARRTLPENGLQEASLPMANASNWNN